MSGPYTNIYTLHSYVYLPDCQVHICIYFVYLCIYIYIYLYIIEYSYIIYIYIHTNTYTLMEDNFNPQSIRQKLLTIGEAYRFLEAAGSRRACDNQSDSPNGPGRSILSHYGILYYGTYGIVWQIHEQLYDYYMEYDGRLS